MEFIARTVTHPNPRLDKTAAIESLKKHPRFKQGTIVVKLEQKEGHWVATLHEPKGKVAGPPPFLDDPVKAESAPTDEVKPDAMEDEGASEEAPKDDSGDEKKKDDGDKKPSIESVMDLVKQIAEKVGVPVDGGDGDKPSLDDMPGEPMDDPLPPVDGPPMPPPGPPKGGPAGPKETIHRKAPLGVTPVGSPSFASTKTASPKVASFDVEEPWTGTIKQAMDAIHEQYGSHGYKVKNIVEDTVDGVRVIRARVSVR